MPLIYCYTKKKITLTFFDNVQIIRCCFPFFRYITIDDLIQISLRLQLQDMHVVQTWDIYELNATSVAETFIMCGILYGLKSVTDRDTVVNFAYDLFR